MGVSFCWYTVTPSTRLVTAPGSRGPNGIASVVAHGWTRSPNTRSATGAPTGRSWVTSSVSTDFAASIRRVLPKRVSMLPDVSRMMSMATFRARGGRLGVPSAFGALTTESDAGRGGGTDLWEAAYDSE